MKHIYSKFKVTFFIGILCAAFIGSTVSAQKVKIRSNNSQTTKSEYTLRTYLVLRITNRGYNREQRREIAEVISDSVVDQTIEVVRKRLKMIGVPAYVVEREKSAPDLIVVKIPGIDDPELVKWIIGMEGRFEIVNVISPPSPALKIYRTDDDAIEALGGTIPSNRRILPNMSCYNRSVSNAPLEFYCPSSPEGWIIAEFQSIVETKDLLKCEAISFSKQANDFKVSCSLKKTSEDAFYQWMSVNINRYIAIVLNGEVKSITYIKSPVRGAPELDAKLTKKSAEALSAALMSGALPPTYYLEYLEERLINEPYRIESNPQVVTTTGYIDILEASASACRIRLIAGEKIYSGEITFRSLSALTRQRINNYQDAVRLLSGRKVNVTLSGLEYSTSSIGFVNMSGMTFSVGKSREQTTQTWSERTTNTETIIDLSADILFDFDKTAIKPDAVPTLIRLARTIRKSTNSIVQLNGFTDSKGTDEYNLDLSERRAEAVKQWLVEKGGINASRLQTKGYGESQPAVQNTKIDGSDNPGGRQKNRRVEIRIPRN